MMKSTYFSIYLLIIGVSLSTTYAQYQEGSLCMTSRNETGICTLLPQCPQAVDDINKGASPFICGFQEKTPIICCDNNQLMPTTTTTEKVTLNRINEQKCLEYGKSVYSWVPALALTHNNTENIKVDQCFQANFLIRGDNILPREYPHLALIGRKENDMYVWDCLGSLISERFVITAAHCLDNYVEELQLNSVRLGAINTNSNSTEYTQDFSIVQKFQHPNYKRLSSYNDIGLIQLDQDVKFTSHVRPACLQNEFEIHSQKVISHGWERSNKSDITFVRMDITVSACNNSYSFGIGSILSRGVLPDVQICTKSQEERRDDYCQDVSGSPLTIPNKDVYCMYKIIGISSFGTCANNIAGLYTRVSNYVPWIESVVWSTS